VFTRVLVPALTRPGLDLGGLAVEVREEVARLAGDFGHDQRPAYYDETIGGRVYLAGLAPKPEKADPVVIAPAVDPAERAWTAVQNATGIADFEVFIRRYPDSFYADLARNRIDELRKRQTAVVVPVIPVRPDPALGPCGGATMVSLASRAAGPLSAGEECALKPKAVFRECAQCPEMVVVPAGSFTMGSPAGEEGRYGDEGPQHVVKIGRPFAVGQFHVTVDQFAAFVAETRYDAGSKCLAWNGDQWVEKQGGSWRNPGFAQNGSHPTVCVNWNDAKAYVDWLVRKTGKPYRLLTEAEWEYAARARTEPGAYPRFWFGNEEKDLCRYGNGADQTAKTVVPGAKDWPAAPCSDGYAYTSPARAFPANGFGLLDMFGNAWQWTEDCYHESYDGAPADGSAFTTGDCSRHILRGGSWYYVPRLLRAADRNGNTPVYRSSFYGFRLGRTLTP
jgi:formylglycine-generating enzyme required for sulfatase activity